MIWQTVAMVLSTLVAMVWRRRRELPDRPVAELRELVARTEPGHVVEMTPREMRTYLLAEQNMVAPKEWN
jgi:hypothetical protein